MPQPTTTILLFIYLYGREKNFPTGQASSKTSTVSRSNKPLLRVLAGETVGPPPIWLMRQAGRYLPEYRALRAKAGSFLDLCFNPALATEVTLQPIERYAFDAAILFSDILVVPHALGQGVRFVEGEGPKLDAIRDPSGVANLSLTAMTSAGTPLAPVYETVERVRAALPERVALIGFAGAPWTVATYMVEGGTSRDFHHIKQWAARDELGFAALMEILVEATAAHLAYQAEAGAEVVQLFESHAGVLSAADFDRWIVRPTAEIVKMFRERPPDVPVIGFPRGAGLNYSRYVAETGVDAVGLDTTVPPAWAQDALQRQVPVQGNLDPVRLLVGGDAMRHAADDILAALGDGPLIFNLGNGVIKETPPAHVAELVAHVRQAAGV